MIKKNPFIVIILIALVFSACRRIPVSKFTVSSSSITPGEVVHLENETFNAKSYLWDFGDGISSTEREPSHIYENEGNYSIRLTVYSKKGSNSSTSSKNITVAFSQDQLDAQSASLSIRKTWSLDSINLDEINGVLHYNFPTSNLWGGTNEYLWIFDNTNYFDSFRDGIYESTESWQFESGTICSISNFGAVNVTQLDSNNFYFNFISTSDSAYAESWFFSSL